MAEKLSVAEMRAFRQAFGEYMWRCFPLIEERVHNALLGRGLDAHLSRRYLFGVHCSDCGLDDELNREVRREAFSWLGVYDFASGAGAAVKSPLMEKWRTSRYRAEHGESATECEARSVYPYGPCEMRWLRMGDASLSAERALVLERLDRAFLANFNGDGEQWPFDIALERVLQSIDWGSFELSVQFFGDVAKIIYANDVIEGSLDLSNAYGGIHTQFGVCVRQGRGRLDTIGTGWPNLQVNARQLIRDFGFYLVPEGGGRLQACILAILIIFQQYFGFLFASDWATNIDSGGSGGLRGRQASGSAL